MKEKEIYYAPSAEAVLLVAENSICNVSGIGGSGDPEDGGND